MPLEIEAKFRVRDPDAVRGRLRAAGAEASGDVLEHNTYFDTPGRELQQAGSGLRLRVNEGPDGARRAVLTHKGPRRDGELKIRPETELEVEAAGAADAFLQALGFAPTIRFQKRRAIYRLGGAEVVLDELPELGFFLEIEAPDEATVQRVRAALGLADEPVIRTAYVSLVAEHLTGTGRTELSFPAAR